MRIRRLVFIAGFCEEQVQIEMPKVANPWVENFRGELPDCFHHAGLVLVQGGGTNCSTLASHLLLTTGDRMFSVMAICCWLTGR